MFVDLRRFVADKMGGEIERGKLMEFSWELHISQLKVDLQSNIIPLGKIERGIHYHRALLYKVGNCLEKESCPLENVAENGGLGIAPRLLPIKRQ